jgi:hypothetical protein
MRDLARNLSLVRFKTYKGETEIINKQGFPSGNFAPVYSDIQTARLCVSANKGTSETSQYGTLLDYDRVMTTSDVNCPINEDSVLWLDGASTDEPWNYIVKRRSQSLNGVSYAVKKVTVSQNEVNASADYHN